MRLTKAHLIATLAFSGRLLAQGLCSGSDLGPGANLNGFVPFPPSDPWNQDISGAAVHPDSDSFIWFIGTLPQQSPTFSGVTSSGTPRVPHPHVPGFPPRR